MAALIPPLTDAMIDNATATVLAQKYNYTPKHLRRMQRESPKVWLQARQEVQIALGSALGHNGLLLFSETEAVVQP